MLEDGAKDDAHRGDIHTCLLVKNEIYEYRCADYHDVGEDPIPTYLLVRLRFFYSQLMVQSADIREVIRPAA